MIADIGQNGLEARVRTRGWPFRRRSQPSGDQRRREIRRTPVPLRKGSLPGQFRQQRQQFRRIHAAPPLVCPIVPYNLPRR